MLTKVYKKARTAVFSIKIADYLKKNFLKAPLFRERMYFCPTLLT